MSFSNIFYVFVNWFHVWNTCSRKFLSEFLTLPFVGIVFTTRTGGNVGGKHSLTKHMLQHVV